MVAVGWVALAVLATYAGRTAAQPPAAVPVVEELDLQGGADAMVVVVRTSVPAPGFRCALPVPGVREVVIEWPEAISRLQRRYVPQSPLLKGVLVETEARGGPGVRVHLDLGDAQVSSIAEEGRSVRISLVRRDARAEQGPTPGDYLVGVGDKLEVTVFGHDDLTKVVEIRSDGSINLPLIGDLAAAGLPPTRIDEEITRRLAKDYLVDPQVSVEIKEYQSRWVTILGEVRTPGRYALKHDMRLIDLLAEAGGGTKDAGSRILVTRRQAGGGTSPIAVDRDLLFSREDQGANIPLFHQDIVTVQEKEVFYIRGEVAKPGPYFLESGMTILKAISVAGGLTQFANRKDIELLRVEEGGQGPPKRVIVNLKAIEGGKKQDIALRPNDTVIVPRRVF